MSSKRSRVGSGSSAIFNFDAVASSAAAAAASRQQNNPNKCMKPSPPFFIAPPSPLSDIARQPVVGFLQKCYYCGKNILPDTKIFMYRDFCAFCTEECRGFQMAIDVKESKQKDLIQKGINFVPDDVE